MKYILLILTILTLNDLIDSLCNNNNNNNNSSSSTSAQTSVSEYSNKYCAYKKRISVDSRSQRFVDGISLIHLERDNILFSETTSETSQLTHRIKEISSNVINGPNSVISQNDFKFFEDIDENTNEHVLKLEINQNVDLPKLDGKSIKFKLYNQQRSGCLLMLDFEKNDDIEDEKLERVEFVYFESLENDRAAEIHRMSIDLQRVVPDLFCDLKSPYSIVCLKCNLNDDAKETGAAENRVSMEIVDDSLEMSVLNIDKNVLYNDVSFLIEQAGTRKFYLNVRIINAFNRNSDTNEERQSRQRPKRYSPYQKKYSSLNSNLNGVNGIGGGSGLVEHKTLNHIQTSNFNLLKTATLGIDEETVGLQTKLKIYDHVWVDYYLNASDYVKQRIQLIAPDNPILNITKPFDFESAGSVHNFQIIFTRKLDKRTIKDIKPITIKVLDLNDEPPVWVMDEPVPYTAVVERDPKPGILVFQFVAQDPDTQSEIIYTLHSKSPNTTRLEMKDGKLFTKSGAPFQHDQYKVLVSAHDAKAHSLNKFSLGNTGAPILSGLPSNQTQEIFAELTIIVGKKAPQFYQSEYKVNISEDAPIGFNVVQMRAKSFNPDPFNKKHLRYSLQTRQGQSAEFSIYSENGTVILARKVDYETDIREYNLVVHVTEQSGWLLSSSARLNVYIEDHNDNAPQFTLSEYVRNHPVAEDLSPDTFIIQVEVQDRDSGQNSEIDWQVSNSNFYIKPFSETDTKRAKIYNEQKLDFEIPQHMYRFDVIACDRGQPPLCASAKVSVPISNINDEKPKFDQKVIYATLDENVPSAAYVTTVQATDGDGDRIFFKLKDESGPFEINRESGIVKIKFDRKIDPREDYYNLTVYAEDDGSCCCLSPTSNYPPNRVHLKFSQTLNSQNCKIKTNREEANLLIRIRDINDHAPKFHDCDRYSNVAQVEEQKPIGTFVIEVQAKDDDKGENGEVEYEILSTHTNEHKNPFRIDPLTGVITTNTVFDREANGKFNEYSITVKAKDRGKPHPLSDACSFRIKIIDINDHPPMFHEAEYKLSIKYGAQPGQSIQRIIASDMDSGKNAEIRYRIEQSGQYYHYFDVDESTGMISLRKEIAHNIKRPIIFNLIAEDSGNPPKSSSVSVSVGFADRDNEPPKWLPETEKRFERTVRIPEAISLNQVVETLDAESNYAPNSKLIFDFSPKPQPESFIIQQEKIPGTNRYRGKITVYQPLDAETQNFYQLHVRVQNAAAQPMEITGIVKVEILDSNDNIPLFTSPTYLANVSENFPPGTYVTKVTAEDKDISAPNNVVIYTITDPDHGRKFQIDQYTGNITTRVMLNREETKVYFIDVTACDSAMSDRPNMNTPNCRTANVRIDVSDTNDNEPYFNFTLYEATVHENAERGTPILTVQANDDDEDNQQLRYIITDGNEDNVFAVRESIGEIYVANNGKLDYETLDQYHLTLTVSDGIHNSTTKVKIDLLDVNDNPPIFTETPPYEIELVEEDLNFPRVILKINATDGDIKRPNTIVFKINYNYSSFRPFNINPHTGEIILQEKLDRDYPNGRPVWSFNVIASDEGGNKGSMDSTAVVNVRLIDINDNAPVFDKPPYIGHILENSKPGTLIMTVTANDYDDPAMGQNAALRYQIAENKKFGNLDVFSINDTSGQIYQNMKLDREQIDKYTIEVCATDGSGKRGCGQVTIYVDDANDQAPVFQSNMYTETINEDWPIGERVLVVTATDKDIGLNAELSYGLKSECLVRSPTYTGNDDSDCVDGIREPKYFKVDTEREANSGFVKLAKQVNYDPPDYHRLFKLNVSVSDGQAMNYTTVFINVADVNDEAPKFKEPVKNVPVLESIPPLTIITNFTAEDLDTNDANRRFSYSLDRKSEGSHEFTIDQNGNLYNLEPLDRETKDKYILRIFAIDEGYPPQTGIATLNLEIHDVNDNYPIFAESYNPIVYENSSPGQFLVKIRAQDLDSPDNGPPFTFELPDRLSVWPSKGPKFNMSFHVDELNGDNYATIYSLVKFDREAAECGQKQASYSNGFSYQKEYDTHNKCKEYKIPVLIRDSGKPPMSGINYLTVTIGDVNDNPHYAGTKKILVYDYKGSVSKASRPNLIGTVYAEDKDDWDASDKEFKFVPETDETIRQHFDIIETVSELKNPEMYIPGSIVLKPGLKPGTYEFKVSVKDLTRPNDEVQISTVIVVIKQIEDDMVQNSGSIRLSGVKAERLLETRYSPNERSLLNEIQTYLSEKIYKLGSEDNMEFFSIINHKSLPDTVDLRFSAHGSPIYKTERLNGLLAHNKTDFQQWLRSLDPSLELITVGIDECSDSEKKCKDSGCRSTTHFTNQVALVNANKTSLVGVMAVEKAECVCKSLQGYSLLTNNGGSCDDTNYCLNGGMCVKHGSIQKCQCSLGFDGPRCQKTVRNFNSSGGFAWLNALPQCADLVISLEFITSNNRGLIFYNGPITNEQQTTIDKNNPARYQQDFIALQLDKARLMFQVKQGVNGKTHSYILNNYNRSLNDGVWHRVDIYKTGFKYRVTIDRCIDDYPSVAYGNNERHKTLSQNNVNVFINGCEHEFQVQIHDLFINTNQYYPLQIGGVYDRQNVPKTLDYKGNFVGCVKNFKVNGELYDLQVDTPTTMGFSSNSLDSCPRAEKLCNPTNETNYCLNGICDSNFFKSECICKPGYRGSNCEFKALPFDFQTPGMMRRSGSYIKYRYVYQSDSRQSTYDSYLKKFTKIQLLFRTRENTTDKPQTLFQITSPNRAQYVYLEINGGRLQFRYDIGGGESMISISHIPVNDGKWHFVRAERYGKEATLILDDGEGVKMNYTFGLPNGAREMDVDRDSIFLGAKVVQIKVSGYEISRDYHDSCMMDVRFDDKPLPYTQQEERAYEDIAIKMEAVNVKDGCASVDYCKGIFCPSSQQCVDQWRLGECQCPKGKQLNGTKCQEINDCQLCYQEGTWHCAKYSGNRVVAYENFQNVGFFETNPSVAGDYPPDSWYIQNDVKNEINDGDNIWRVSTHNDGSQITGFKCVCKKGYFGQYCNALANKDVQVLMGMDAILTIIICLFICIVMVLIFVVYSKTKRTTPKSYMLGVDPNDEVRETIINYVEEGCPDVDQSAYDITQLVKPVDPSGSNMSSHPLNMSDGSTAIDGEFQPAVPRQKPPLQEISYIRRDVPPVTQISGMKAHRPQNTDVGDFINSKLREIDNDPVQPPYDSLQEYAYEGEGSMYGSTLSSLDVRLDPSPNNRLSTFSPNKKDPASLTHGSASGGNNNADNNNVDSNLDSELDQIKNWGPKFNKISNIYGLKSNDE